MTVILIIMALLFLSAVVPKYQPRLTGFVNLAAALLLWISRVLPGTADLFDWMFLVSFVVTSAVFLLPSFAKALR